MNEELVGKLSNLLGENTIADYKTEVQKQYLKMNMEILKIRAEGFAKAADYMARQCENLAEYEKKRAEFISQIPQMKPIRISTTVKFGAVEDDPANSGIIEEKKTKSIPEVAPCPEIVSETNEQNDLSDTPQIESEAEKLLQAGGIDETRKEFYQFYLNNQDVMIGVLFCGTLQFSTCLLCAALDGHIWKNPAELHLVPALPMHEGCRCVLLPVTELDEINSSKRPAEASDFWHDAAVRYAKRFPDKSWDTLSASTKLKYYYEEQKLFEQETGHPAFEEIPQNTNFSDWLRTKPEELQRQYLGELRANLFIEHNLNLIDFVDQSAWTLYSDEDLIAKYISPPTIERNEPEMTSVKLTCPQCGQHYSVEIDPSLIYDDMDCQNCGGKIPVSAKQPPAQEVDYDNARLQCPSCNQVFTPLFDLKDHVGGCDCPNCGSGLRAPLEQYLANRKPEQPASNPAPENKPSPPPAAAFFFICSIISFIAGDIAAIADSVALSSSLYWSGVSFILMAIYLKIQWK